MKGHSFFVVWLLFLSGCVAENNNSKENSVGAFSSVIELEGTRVFEEEYSLFQIAKVDSFIIISTARDTLFHVYDKNQEHFAGLGQKGRGPREFTRVPAIEDVMKENASIKFLVNDEIRKELMSLNLTASLDSNKLIIENRYTLPVELRGAIDFLYLDKNKFVGVYDDRFDKQLDEQRGGFYYNAKTDTFEIFSLQNFKIKPYEMMPATNVNARMPAISPDRSKVAIVTLFSPKMAIFEVGSKTPARYLLDSNLPEGTFELEAFKKGEVIEYYKYIDATNNYIYLLHSGNKIKDNAGETWIQVLDWKGNPSNQYLIPSEYNLSMFVVDEKNKLFYGLSYPNDAIYKFDYSAVN